MSRILAEESLVWRAASMTRRSLLILRLSMLAKSSLQFKFDFSNVGSTSVGVRRWPVGEVTYGSMKGSRMRRMTCSFLHIPLSSMAAPVDSARSNLPVIVFHCEKALPKIAYIDIRLDQSPSKTGEGVAQEIRKLNLDTKLARLAKKMVFKHQVVSIAKVIHVSVAFFPCHGRYLYLC
jgi:hypothetical protein